MPITQIWQFGLTFSDVWVVAGAGGQGRMTWLNHRVSKAEILLAFQLGPGVGP